MKAKEGTFTHGRCLEMLGPAFGADLVELMRHEQLGRTSTAFGETFKSDEEYLAAPVGSGKRGTGENGINLSLWGAFLFNTGGAKLGLSNGTVGRVNYIVKSCLTERGLSRRLGDISRIVCEDRLSRV